MATALEYLQDQRSTEITCFREAHSRSGAGDVVDVFRSSGKRQNIVMAHVRGLDALAAGHARYLRHAVRTLVDLHAPGSLLDCLGLAFHRRAADYGTESSASLFLGALQGRALTYASAGHDLALLFHANGRHQRVPLSGNMLGVKGAQNFKQRSIAVVPGDWLVLATDGITRAQDAQGALFGASGVERSMLAAIRAGADDPAARVLDAARTHGRAGSFDDASVVCVRLSA
jgi:phosphoserine phosphatase RsbU/P